MLWGVWMAHRYHMQAIYTLMMKFVDLRLPRDCRLTIDQLIGVYKQHHVLRPSCAILWVRLARSLLVWLPCAAWRRLAGWRRQACGSERFVCQAPQAAPQLNMPQLFNVNDVEISTSLTRSTSHTEQTSSLQCTRLLCRSTGCLMSPFQSSWTKQLHLSLATSAGWCLSRHIQPCKRCWTTFREFTRCSCWTQTLVNNQTKKLLLLNLLVEEFFYSRWIFFKHCMLWNLYIPAESNKTLCPSRQKFTGIRLQKLSIVCSLLALCLLLCSCLMVLPFIPAQHIQEAFTQMTASSTTVSTRLVTYIDDTRLSSRLWPGQRIIVLWGPLSTSAWHTS